MGKCRKSLEIRLTKNIKNAIQKLLVTIEALSIQAMVKRDKNYDEMFSFLSNIQIHNLKNNLNISKEVVIRVN